MSYSRWSNSNWYSFWSTSSAAGRDNQVLCLWYSMDPRDIRDFTYKDLQTMTAEKIMEMYACSSSDAEEAMDYVRQFISDVNFDTNNNIIVSTTE